ncbi:MAG: TIGR03960 family B12-binding radical SAM protein [Deltaproteobacteria bacterium]|nr:TIGR03960 family B12-binding radical SAM protein [Deltaproteobacteria bacterium]
MIASIVVRRSLISWYLKKKVKDLLSKEQGTIYKEWGGKTSVCLVYPNSYFLGMSNLGFQAIYHLLNELAYVVCERTFLPSTEDISELERTNTTLFSLESQRSLAEFDIIAFSISFEEDYLNILRIFDLAKIPFLSSERKSAQPLIMAGGVAVSLNPEPIADFFDLFAIGEGEEFVSEFLDAFQSAQYNAKTKEHLLEALISVEGVYIPSFYKVTYKENFIEKIQELKRAPEKVKSRKVKNLNAFPVPASNILTNETNFRNTYLLELERGCGRGCRFCAAGFIYLPPRERDLAGLKKEVMKGMEKTGKVGLVGAAVSEYSGLKSLCKTVIENEGEITLSSIRLDVLDGENLQILRSGGYKTMTIAPEAGSERLRNVINKKISEQNILESIALISKAGIQKLKLYFIIGLPTETIDDAIAVVDLVLKIQTAMHGGLITLSINPFIPKPVTPFQWCSYADMKSLKDKTSIIKNGLQNKKGINYSFLSQREGYIQTLLSVGDRRVGNILVDAHRKGWREALKNSEPNPDLYVSRERGFSEILPWDFIDTGIKKEYLWKEYQRALKVQTTPPCDTGRCIRCGVCIER